jgi:hypothetical protein
MALDRRFKIDNNSKKVEESKEYLRDRDKLIAIKSDKIEKQYIGLEKNLRELQAKRGEVSRAMVSKEDYGDIIRTSFAATRKTIIERVMDHVKACQAASAVPFTPDIKHILKDYELHWLLFLALNDADMEDIIKGLPDGGLTLKERSSKIETINKEIKSLQTSLKAELEQEKALQ